MGEEAKSGKDVHLESVAKKMSEFFFFVRFGFNCNCILILILVLVVEKRRIYDIVNVMEALEAMSKTNKSYYRWHGLGELPQLMAFLQVSNSFMNIN